MSIFFTSDTHFFHKNILKYQPHTRQGMNVQDMTERMIEIWNNQVSSDDLVYHLGDFSFGRGSETENVLSRLNGRIILVTGNHDRNIIDNSKFQSRFLSIQNYMEIKIDGINVIMFHYPMVQWNKMHYGSFHLFGHIHGKDMGFTGKQMDVGIDSRKDMKLFSWDEVKSFMSTKEILDHH